MSAVHTLKIDISLVVRATQNVMQHQQEHTMQDTEWLLRRLEELRSTRQQRCHSGAVSRTRMKTIVSSAHTALGAAAAIGARGVVAIGTGNQAQAAAVWASFVPRMTSSFSHPLANCTTDSRSIWVSRRKLIAEFQMFLEVFSPSAFR